MVPREAALVDSMGSSLMNAHAPSTRYPQWCRVLAAVGAALIVAAPVILVLRLTFGKDPGADPTAHWLEYSGIGLFFCSEVRPLMWLARGGPRGRAGSLSLLGALAHAIFVATLLLVASSYDDGWFTLWLIAFASQLAWSLYYSAILVRQRTAPA